MKLEMKVNGIAKEINVHDVKENVLLSLIKKTYRLWAPIIEVTYQDEWNDYTTVQVFDHEMVPIGTGVLVI